MTRVLSCLLAGLFLGTSPAAAEIATKNEVWAFGLGGFKHTLRSDDGYGLSGVGSVVQLGRGHIATNWYVNGTIDIISGPYHADQKHASQVDFAGTGFTANFGYGLTSSLRGAGSSYGFALGLHYADIVGRNIEASAPAPGVSVDGITMRVNDFSLMPGIFFSWLEPARPRGNKPILLITRLEGYLLSFSVAMPMLASYNIKYLQTDAAGTASQSKSGPLKGYSFVVQLSALLGA